MCISVMYVYFMPCRTDRDDMLAGAAVAVPGLLPAATVSSARAAWPSDALEFPMAASRDQLAAAQRPYYHPC